MLQKLDETITIEYRKVKNINLYIKPDGRILITAPRSASKRRIMEFVESKENWIEKTRKRVKRAREKREDQQEQGITKEQLEELGKQVQYYAEKWEPVMGVHATHWTIRDMKTRWGSCTVDTGRIRISSRLVHYPESALEYIVVHELCHLLEPSHNERFHGLMSRFLPDWKERRNMLR